jgi:hypothetical protein
VQFQVGPPVIIDSLVAQLIEQHAVNVSVVGLSPTWRARRWGISVVGNTAALQVVITSSNLVCSTSSKECAVSVCSVTWQHGSPGSSRSQFESEQTDSAHSSIPRYSNW